MNPHKCNGEEQELGGRISGIAIILSFFLNCPAMSDCDTMDVACQSPLLILQAKILECVAMPFPRGSSQPRDETWVSCFVRQVLCHLSHQESFSFISPYTHTHTHTHTQRHVCMSTHIPSLLFLREPPSKILPPPFCQAYLPIS